MRYKNLSRTPQQALDNRLSSFLEQLSNLRLEAVRQDRLTPSSLQPPHKFHIKLYHSPPHYKSFACFFFLVKRQAPATANR